MPLNLKTVNLGHCKKTREDAIPDFSFEDQHPGRVIGIDEVGRGPLVGPVVTAAVHFTSRPTEVLRLIKDSKKLNPRKRLEAFESMKPYIIYAVGSATSQEIDRINILEATFLAMCRAVKRFPFTPDFVLVDGNKIPPHLSLPARAIIKGDDYSFSIAAASIIAKITRDHLMEKLSKRYPVYGWEKNAGYPTKEHRQAIESYGITKHHRVSFGKAA